MRTTRRVLAGAAAVTLFAAACEGDHGAAPGEPARVLVATSVAPITSIVANVVGDRADVVGIVPEGTSSHTFEPRPSVAELLARTDVLFLNGLGLEAPIRELAEATLADDAEIVELGRRAIAEDEYLYDASFPEADGRPNPHLWTDPTLALRYAEVVRDEMSARDPAGADVYAANCAAFAAIVDELDAAMRVAFATVPVRTFLTYHDAYAYFARTYGWELIGAVPVSDVADPTPRELAELIDQVRTAGVPAIFGSEAFPSPVLSQIGREAGVAYVDVLRDDDLPGEPGGPEHSWLGLVRYDFVAMTTALGGDAAALEAVVVRDAAPDRAEYPR